jgi:arsenate reductase-like glutaredoxin family protein
VREFLARKSIEPRFIDVRKGPIPPKETVAIVRKHKKAIAKLGGTMRSIDPKTATDAEIQKLFLGREGTMRAPVVSDGTTILAGFDEDSFVALVG